MIVLLFGVEMPEIGFALPAAYGVQPLITLK